MISAKITGIPELKRALMDIPKQLRRKILREALTVGGRIVRDRARQNAPVLSARDPKVRMGFRKPGTIKKRIVVRSSPRERKLGNVGVFVNVKPNRQGAKSPHDPYYWRWVEFGHKVVIRYAGKYTDFKLKGRGRMTGIAARRRRPLSFVAGARFLTSAAVVLPQALAAIVAKLGPALQKFNKPSK